MKNILFTTFLLMLSLLHAQNWQTINNVNHVYDIEKEGDSIYFSSWGGVVEIRGNAGQHLQDFEMINQYNTSDGLVSNDIRNLVWLNFSQSLWMGSSYDGISVKSSNGIQNIGTDLGLPSLRINRILENGAYTYVATPEGLSVFYYLDGVHFPLMLNQHNSITTGGALPNNNIHDLILADNGYLYLAHDAGITYVSPDSLNVNSAWHSLMDDSPIPLTNNYILSSNAEHLAIAANSNIYISDLAHFGWNIIDPDDSNASNSISDILLDSTQQLWVAYGQWNESILSYSSSEDLLLSRTNIENQEVQYWHKAEDSLKLNHISKIEEIANEIYICTWGDGIARYREAQWEYYNPDNIAFPKITMSKVDQNNKLWFASGVIGDYVVPKGTMGVCSFANNEWQAYDIDNSPLHSNNILCLEVDARNRKWFGAWDAGNLSPHKKGLSIYDESDNSWKWLYNDGTHIWNHETNDWGPLIDYGTNLITGTIGGIYKDLHDNMLVLSYDGGVNIMDENDQVQATFFLPNTTFQRVVNAYHNGRQYFFGTEADNGLSIWNHDSLPISNGEHWESRIPSELKGGKIYGVASTETPYSPSGWQHFVSAGTGLYVWDEFDWYKFDVYIKKHRYNFSNSTWLEDTLYYADEERLFGGVRTYPISILGDPFGRIWIGTEDNGISMYNPITERFTNYYQGNSPLLSNQIISLGYDPLEGRLLIGTTNGLNTLRIGRTVKPDTQLKTVKAYPNPFRPDGITAAQIVNLPQDSMPKGQNECRIFSSSGALVKKLDESPFARFEWDGTNDSGKIVSSGVYFFVVTDEDGNAARGKIAVIR